MDKGKKDLNEGIENLYAQNVALENKAKNKNNSLGTLENILSEKRFEKDQVTKNLDCVKTRGDEL